MHQDSSIDLNRKLSVWMYARLLSSGLVFLGLITGCVTPLGKAVEQGDVQGVRTLLDQGADINEYTRNCGRPLKCAASLGNIELVRLLLDRRARVDTGDPLAAAAEAGHIEIVKLLLDREAPVRGSGALIGAAGSGNVEIARLLLDRGAISNENYPWIGTGALAAATKAGSVEIVQLLLDRGAKVNGGDITPLMVAAGAGQLEIVKLLLDHGADVDAKSTFVQDTPLHYAARGETRNHTKIVQLLLEQGADWTAKDHIVGSTPLDEAKRRGSPDTVRLLQQVKAGLLSVAQRPSAQALVPTGIAISDVDRALPSGAKSKKNGYAIVVGVEQYQQKLSTADFAAHDAEVMGQYLTKSFGYPNENVVVLLNDRATKTGMEKYIESWLPDHVEAGDSVFIYFSGHGAPNAKTGKAYLMPYDGDPAFVEKTGYPLDRLYDSLSALRVKEVVVMLDSCFSGAGGRSVLAEGMRPMVLSVENPVLAKGNVVVLAASAGAQASSTYKEQSHGLLTYYFLKGLQGEADQNHDGRIELGELYEYLKPQVERTARKDYHNEQTPQLLGNPDMLGRGVVLTGASGR